MNAGTLPGEDRSQGALQQRGEAARAYRSLNSHGKGGAAGSRQVPFFVRSSALSSSSARTMSAPEQAGPGSETSAHRSSRAKPWSGSEPRSANCGQAIGMPPRIGAEPSSADKLDIQSRSTGAKPPPGTAAFQLTMCAPKRVSSHVAPLLCVRRTRPPTVGPSSVSSTPGWTAIDVAD